MLWRSADRVQFELGSRAVLVDGLSTQTARSLTTSAEEPEADALPALRHLAELGMVWLDGPPPAPANGPLVDERRAPPAPYLAAELTALSSRLGTAAGDALRARGRARVAIHGVGRVGPHVAAVLAASGVGCAQVTAMTDVKLHHAMPGGVLPGEESQKLASAARAAVQRAAPGAEVRVGDAVPDLVILAIDEPIDDDRRAALHASGAAHLVVALGPARAVVGPLVIPGLTSCLRCADLHRSDRDDAWPRLAVQLAVDRKRRPSSELAVATMATGVAAMQALAFLDGHESACVDGTLELHPPDWRLRRRSWPPHPKCGCCMDP